MKLIGELKDKAAKAETREELNDILLEAGMELTSDELKQIDGGVFSPLTKGKHKCLSHPSAPVDSRSTDGKTEYYCSICGKKAQLVSNDLFV